METSTLTSYSGFRLSADPTQFVPEKPTQLGATVLGSFPPIDKVLSTQPRSALIYAQNSRVENAIIESVVTPHARFLIDLEKEVGVRIQQAVQKEVDSQCNGLAEAVIVRRENSLTPSSKGTTEFPVKPKDGFDFSYIDSVSNTRPSPKYILKIPTRIVALSGLQRRVYRLYRGCCW